ncbi:GNAT family N-acetyltransferase [Pacificimonas sp. WHA3]|uniref:GNAT family N-acetyltransferase n=1 Tax=Pacificimonas pallii TaxID=2827236 RepID=A0ABS6SEM0_9SPHN|nr:GNAT family N-acetyltransferase [Pacificimonas pallii]MBV7256725.1 GNAT family N-acetyltransferase [Pacificimonas pallii]
MTAARRLVLPETLCVAQRSQARMVADLTAEAFRHDPFNKWLFGDFRAMRAAFRALSQAIYTGAGTAHLLTDGGGASMWLPPGADDGLGAIPLAKLLAAITWYGGPAAARRAKLAGDVMAAHHPPETHWYLFTVGTLPDRRGQGLGKALLAPVLAHCDATNMPVYLENSNPANHGFYAAHGFRRHELIHVEKGAPPLEAMWREPAARVTS